uniref:erbin isoform X2 n=1 Tax=Myxine glutinosa TaxID=7769 RepID=UPI00358F3A4F
MSPRPAPRRAHTMSRKSRLLQRLVRCHCLRGDEEPVSAIDYSHCCLQQVPKDVFIFERTLHELNLDANQLEELPKALFNCMALRRLTVSDNDISILPLSVSNLDNLCELDVSKNGIQEIPENIKSCKQLRTLDASVNPIIKLPEGLTQLTNLTELYMNDAFLEILPANFGRLTALHVLELRENHLSTLPQSMGALTELERLDIGSNEFREWPTPLEELFSLKELWMDSNQLAVLPEAVGRLEQLTYLDVSKNQLEHLEPGITGCSNLQDLYLSSNILQTLPDNLGSLINLTTFKVDDNQLISLPDTLGQLQALEELDCSSNELSVLPSSIGRLRNIRTLIADENHFVELPPEIGSCQNVTVLSLRCNELQRLPPEMGQMERLMVLNITHNRLSHLPLAFTNLRQLMAIWLSDNQSKSLIPLQTEERPDTGEKVLTNYMFPQQPRREETERKSDSGSFNAEQWEQQRQQRSQVAFECEDVDDRREPDGVRESTLKRYPTPYPDELKNLVKTAQSVVNKIKDEGASPIGPVNSAARHPENSELAVNDNMLQFVARPSPCEGDPSACLETTAAFNEGLPLNCPIACEEEEELDPRSLQKPSFWSENQADTLPQAVWIGEAEPEQPEKHGQTEPQASLSDVPLGKKVEGVVPLSLVMEVDHNSNRNNSNGTALVPGISPLKASELRIRDSPKGVDNSHLDSLETPPTSVNHPDTAVVATVVTERSAPMDVAYSSVLETLSTAASPCRIPAIMCSLSVKENPQSVSSYNEKLEVDGRMCEGFEPVVARSMPLEFSAPPKQLVLRKDKLEGCTEPAFNLPPQDASFEQALPVIPSSVSEGSMLAPPYVQLRPPTEIPVSKSRSVDEPGSKTVNPTIHRSSSAPLLDEEETSLAPLSFPPSLPAKRMLYHFDSDFTPNQSGPIKPQPLLRPQYCPPPARTALIHATMETEIVRHQLPSLTNALTPASPKSPCFPSRHGSLSSAPRSPLPGHVRSIDIPPEMDAIVYNTRHPHLHGHSERSNANSVAGTRTGMMLMRPRASESDYLSPREIATLGRGTSAGSAVPGKPHYSRSYTLDAGSIGQGHFPLSVGLHSPEAHSLGPYHEPLNQLLGVVPGQEGAHTRSEMTLMAPQLGHTPPDWREKLMRHVGNKMLEKTGTLTDSSSTLRPCGPAVVDGTRIDMDMGGRGSLAWSTMGRQGVRTPGLSPRLPHASDGPWCPSQPILSSSSVDESVRGGEFSMGTLGRRDVPPDNGRQLPMMNGQACWTPSSSMPLCSSSNMARHPSREQLIDFLVQRQTARQQGAVHRDREGPPRTPDGFFPSPAFHGAPQPNGFPIDRAQLSAVGHVEEFRVRIDKNPGLGFSVTGGIGNHRNPFKPSDTGIFVMRVQPDGPACSLLLPGDKIVQANGYSFVGVEHEQAVNVLKSLSNPVELVVQRDVSV